MSDAFQVESKWEFCFDPQDTGILEGWFRKKPEKTETVQLPHAWSRQSGRDVPQIGFYFSEFLLDKSFAGKRIVIRLESLDPVATVWLNGEELVNSSGSHQTLEVEASHLVKPDDNNFLAIRLRSVDSPEQPDDKARQEIPVGGIYQRYHYAGILGTVSVFGFPKAGVRAINCFPDYEADRVTLEAKLWNTKNHTIEIEYTITNPDGDAGSVTKKIKVDHENGGHSLNIQLDDGKPWSPWAPTLYTVEAGVVGGYKIKRSFGIRRVSIERGIFQINHQPLRLRGVLFPQVFPFLGGTPATERNLRKELQQIKDAGFNVIRSGGAPFAKDVLDNCDQIGLLVLQESPCYNQKSNRDSLESLKHQLQAMVDRDGAHPCIFGWVVGSENGSMVLENGNKLLRFMSEIDPSRPSFSNLRSVYLDSQGGGKVDLCKVFEPATAAINPYESHNIHAWFPVSVRSFSMLANYCTSKEAKTLSDGLHGSKSFWERYNYMREDLAGKVLVDGLGIGVPENTAELLKEAKKFGDSYEVRILKGLNASLEEGLKARNITQWADVDAFWAEASDLIRESLSKQIDALSINPQVGGIVLENWADHGGVFSGMLDWFRQPKKSLEIVKRANRPIRIIADTEERTPYIGTSASINIHMINDANLGDYGLLLRVKGPNGRIWHQESLPGKAKNGLNTIGKFKFPIGLEKGKFSFDLTLSKSNKEIYRAEESVLVPPEVKLDTYLPRVQFIGDYSDSIKAVAGKEDSSIIVFTQFANMKASVIKALLDRVQNGASLIFGALTREDAQHLAHLNVLPFPIACFRSTGSIVASFHYIQESPEFRDLPKNCIMDHAYAELAPYYSLRDVPNATVSAGSVTLPFLTRGETKVRWGSDVCRLKHGKGEIVFFQYRIFDRLGKNALADALFGNLVDSCQ